MAYQMEKISGNQVKFNFQVPAGTFDDAMAKAYQKLRGRINVPGFRKGKAPRKLIENMYGEGVFYDDAFDMIFPDLYEEAVTKENITPVDQPELKLSQIGSGKELQFEAIVYVLPDVSLGEYKGLKAVKRLPPVTQESINARIEEDLRKVTTQQDVEGRKLENGDSVELDYSGSIDGVKFDGGTAERQTLKLGSGQFIPGFEDQMIGMEIGEEKDLKLQFPADYNSKELAGKDAVFHVKVHGAKSEVKPELDDDFAQDVSEFKTFDEYQKNIIKQLEEERDKSAEAEVENNLIQQAVDAADCDIPKAMVERQIDQMIRNMQMRMQFQGLDYNDYLKYTGMSEDQVRDMFRQEAQNTVKTELVLDKIREKEEINPTEEEILAVVREYAEETKQNADQYIENLKPAQKERFADLAATRHLIKQLVKDAVITVDESEESEAINPSEVMSAVNDALADDETESK